MSNTANVTPYESEHASLIGAVTAAAIVGAVLYVSSTASRTDRRQQKAQRRADIRRRLLEQARPPIDTVCLRVNHCDGLLATARDLGYALVDTPQPPASATGSLPTVLVNDSGDYLAMQVVDDRLVVSSTAGQPALFDLVRADTLRAAQRFMAARGGAVQTRRTADGSVELQVRESGADGGGALLTARIAPDGKSVLDIDNVRGNRCEALLREYERATGGKAVNTRRKAAYFALPGEPARVQVRS